MSKRITALVVLLVCLGAELYAQRAREDGTYTRGAETIYAIVPCANLTSRRMEDTHQRLSTVRRTNDGVSCVVKYSAGREKPSWVTTSTRSHAAILSDLEGADWR